MYIAHINSKDTIQTCTEHCRNSATMSGAFLYSEGFSNLGYLAGLIHDCGKFTDEFSDYIKRANDGDKVRKGEVIHSFAGVSFAINRFHKGETPQDKKEMIKNLTSEFIAYAVGAHHGLFDCYDQDSKCGINHRLTKQPKYDRKAAENFLKECSSFEEFDKLFEKACVEVGSFVDKAVTIFKSQAELFFAFSLLTRLITSAVVDADRTDTASFMNETPMSFEEADSNLWAKCLANLEKYTSFFPKESEIAKARGELSDLCFKAGIEESGIFKLNLPTGAGKTLSSLRFALNHAKLHNKKRIILLSPLLSILEQNAKEVRKAIDFDEIVLEHHSNIVNDISENEEHLNEYDYLAETWNKPIIVSTLVQFLNTLFSGKMSSIRRFHSLSDSIIVIDEVQTVPDKMMTLFNLTVNFLVSFCNASIVLCSATQPEFGHVNHAMLSNITDIIPKSEMNKYKSVFKRTTIVDKGFLREDEISDFVKALCADHSSILVVCNKKKEAEGLFLSVKDSDAQIKCYHLSASMCPEHRIDILNSLKDDLKNKRRVLCVSTQVIEAGVDISFETVVRYCAGIDNIVQSAGRCNRNGENSSQSPVYVINCSDENLTRLKEINSAKTASEKLFYCYSDNPELFDNDLTSEKSISFYYDSLYSEMNKDYRDYLPSNKYLPSLFEMLSNNSDWISDNNRYLLCQAFKTAGENFEALDSDQVTLIVPYRDGEVLAEEIETAFYQGADLTYLKSLVEKSKPYTVAVARYLFEDLKRKSAVRELSNGRIILLNKSFYDDSTGVLSDEKEESECNTLIL